MNREHVDIAPPPRNFSHTGGLARRSVRILLRRPATAKSPAARWAAILLADAGAVLLVWSGIIHLQLWSDGYRDISVVGPLFLIQGVGSIVLALVLVAFRRLVLMAAGAILLAATGAGLLLSASIGLFGYQESLAVPYAVMSLVVEFAGAAVLAAAAVIVFAARSLPRAPWTNLFEPRARMKECAKDGNSG